MTDPALSAMTAALTSAMSRFERVLERVEALLPPAPPAPDWTVLAHRWRTSSAGSGGRGWLEPVRHVAHVAFDDLQNVDRQKRMVLQNTRQFVQGLPANNVLLTGARGTGKSSLVKACLHGFADQGLRLIEVDKSDLHHLHEIVDLIDERPEKFIVFCDDLSFEEGEPGYKALKVVLDGSISGQTDNVLIYATSNRRHLLPEYMSDNAGYKHTPDGEVHPGEVVEEKVSLSERFGLWISFYPFRQDDYLGIVRYWLQTLGIAAEDEPLAEWRAAALQFTLERGSRSGRVAWQFAKDWAGRQRSASA
jgi:predicted AAA+ superfamily ATPase